MENIFTSWKTSISGLVVLIAGLAIFFSPDPEITKWALGVLSLAAAYGFATAGDGNKSDEERGAK